jgi:uncharacterized Zn-binding protein involved in type VI secretion
MTAFVSGRHFLTLGDRSDHGGTIITGDARMTVNGKPVVRVGDLHACPQYWGDTPHSITKIIAIGCTTNRPFIFSKVLALQGDRTQCGATLSTKNEIGASRC